MISVIMSIILVFLNAIAYWFDKVIIPNYRIKYKDKPPNEAKYSLKICKFTMPLLIGCLIHGVCTTVNSTSDFSINYKPTIVNIDNEDLSDLTPEEKMIEDYIVESRIGIIPKEELEELSIIQLYYIRNGIFAYHGLYFESGYYEKFEWYNGYINTDKEFDWKVFNDFEITNIENIKSIENFKKSMLIK